MTLLKMRFESVLRKKVFIRNDRSGLVIRQKWIKNETKSLTRRPLSTGIFSATLFLQKKVWRRRGSNPRPTGWETKKSSTSPGSNPGPTT